MPDHGLFNLTFQNNWTINISHVDFGTPKAKVSITDSRNYSDCDIYYWTEESPHDLVKETPDNYPIASTMRLTPNQLATLIAHVVTQKPRS